MHCSCNAASCRVRVTTVTVESQNVLCVYFGLRFCQQHKNTECCTKMPLCRIFIAGNNKTCADAASDFNQMWSFSTDFHTSPQYQISPQKFFRREPSWCMETDRQTDATKLIGAFFVTLRTCLKNKTN